MKKGLFALALGTFTLGIAEFIIEGIITDIAHNMHVSIPEAGHLISVYALGVCAGAFSLILMHKYRPKHILMFLASLITFGALAHHCGHLPGQWRHPLLVQLHLAAAADGGRIQPCQHLAPDDSCWWRYGRG